MVRFSYIDKRVDKFQPEKKAQNEFGMELSTQPWERQPSSHTGLTLDKG